MTIPPNLEVLTRNGIVALGICASLGCASADSTQVVNVYSARHYGAMEPMYAGFTAATGIQVRVSQGDLHSLLERLKAEGAQTEADAFFAVDLGGLWLAAEEGLLQSLTSPNIEQNIPENLRDPQDRFFALSQRVRSIAYVPGRVDPSEISTYQSLADGQWRGRLCLRPATNVYTQSLIASLIVAHGEAQTEEIVRGWVANDPEYIDSDTRILQTVAAGGCDVGITNHYYLARLLKADPDFPVRMLWANQDGRGVHRNASGIGVIAGAANPGNAVKLIEWLSSRAGQAADDTGLPGGNLEFPVNPEVAPHAIISDFGEWKADPMALGEFGKYQADAVKLLQRAGHR